MNNINETEEQEEGSPEVHHIIHMYTHMFIIPIVSGAGIIGKRANYPFFYDDSSPGNSLSFFTLLELDYNPCFKGMLLCLVLYCMNLFNPVCIAASPLQPLKGHQ